ncbi:MAG TPA: MFS transporter, partial [Gammaproteobacteria bacterium]|nr:MFS transporter [Gammaproteobacteria bacterium]
MPSAKTKALVSWCLFGWASDTFPILITTFIFSTYFIEHIANNKIQGTYLWANATTIAGIIIAISAPLFGCIADQRGHHKRWLGFFTLLTIFSTGLLWFAYPNPASITFALCIFIIGTISFEMTLIFYNSFLPLIAPAKKLGRISGWGWGLGYLGGIAALSTMLLLNIYKPSWLNTETFQQMRIAGPFSALWFAAFSLPLFLWVKDTAYNPVPMNKILSKSSQELKKTFHWLLQEKNILIFLIARMIYNDGLNTLFAFGGIYAAGTFNFTFLDIIIFGISLNILAGFGAISFAWLDDYLGSKQTIMIALCSLIFFSCLLLLSHSRLGFWFTASMLSIFIGPVQSASRT